MRVFAPLLLTRAPHAPRETLAEYRSHGGYATLDQDLAAESVLAALERGNLRGRGGASFPVARKWRIAAGAHAARKHFVANGGEHEPGSHKDRFLLAHHPHAVLEGLLLGMRTTGASVGWIYVIEDMHAQIKALETALAELRESGVNADLRIHRAPTTYVAGEETAALNSIEGKPAKPRQKPPYPGEAGVDGEPTTVNNVETLAHVPALLRLGADAYRGIGRGSSQGTLLITLPANLRKPGVHEVPFGLPLRTLLHELGGGTTSGRAIRAVLPAMSSGWIDASQLDTTFDHDALKAIGSSPGCAGMTVLEEGDDPLPLLVANAEFFMKEQCGQCPPCRMETNQIVHVLKGVQAGKGGDFRGAIEKVTSFAHKKGRCSLIEMAATPVLTALAVFARELAAKAP